MGYDTLSLEESGPGLYPFHLLIALNFIFLGRGITHDKSSMGYFSTSHLRECGTGKVT